MTRDAKTGLPEWNPEALHDHLQSAVSLEIWTIPYYLTAMYSIKDPSSDAYQLIQSVVYEEMLHAQLAGNIANAYGYVPALDPPHYVGRNVPHLCFRLDTPNPTQIFQPYSAELGPLDVKRINTMCLIEYPEWDTQRTPDLRPKIAEYGSIGEFYAALRVGMTEHRMDMRGGARQMDYFRRFFADLKQQTITLDGEAGWRQALTLVDVITDQGEGQTQGDADIPEDFRNTADGFKESWPHFRKFTAIRDAKNLPETYDGVADPPVGSAGYLAQQRLQKDFAVFLDVLRTLFSGGESDHFGSLMAKLGGDVLTCWQNGAVPKFS